MNFAALLRELYPPQVPRGLHVALLTAQLHTAACPLPQMQCPTPEQLLMGYEVIGVTDVYGMPELFFIGLNRPSPKHGLGSATGGRHHEKHPSGASIGRSLCVRTSLEFPAGP